jgi:hypothetical protein
MERKGPMSLDQEASASFKRQFLSDFKRLCKEVGKLSLSVWVLFVDDVCSLSVKTWLRRPRCQGLACLLNHLVPLVAHNMSAGVGRQTRACSF